MASSKGRRFFNNPFCGTFHDVFRCMLTIIEIAEATGFSKSTVSAVLSGSAGGHASEETRRIILDVATRMGYVPNQMARSLRQRRSNLIAILDSVNFGSYAPEVLRGIDSVLRSNGCQQIHCQYDNYADFHEQIRRLMAFHPDGWIVLGFTRPGVDSVMASLISRNEPMVQVCSTEICVGASGVYVDPMDIGRVAAEYFVSNGHRRVLYAAGGQGMRCLNGFSGVWEKNGLDFKKECTVLPPEVGIDNGRRLFSNWLKGGRRETAVLCYDDEMAGAFMAEAYRNNVRIPEEISVVGIDDRDFCQLLAPSLTSVSLPKLERGLLTGKLLMKQIRAKGHCAPEIINMQPKVIQRESSRKL